MKILPSAYLPPISYFAQIVESPSEVVIDLGEHYVKRSLRNRTRIMTAQGVMELTIPVRKANRPRQPMLSIEIDYSKRWQHQHWMAILSAYRSSPYFEHYAPYIEPLYRREYTLLVDFNRDLLAVIMKLLRMESPIASSVDYITATPSDQDLRSKGALDTLNLALEPYMQIFEDRLPFVADLSILDLLFCEGPNAFDYVGVSRR